MLSCTFICTFKILGSICTTAVYFLGCDAIDFELTLIILTEPSFYMTKMWMPKLRYLGNKKSI